MTLTILVNPAHRPVRRFTPAKANRSDIFGDKTALIENTELIPSEQVLWGISWRVLGGILNVLIHQALTS